MMTPGPSFLLTALAPPPPPPTTLDTTHGGPLNVDCTVGKRNVALPPFGIITTTHPACAGPTTTAGPSLSAPLERHRAALAAQWTGTPIRAIVPLPRRTRVLTATVQDEKRLVIDANLNAPPSATVLGRPPLRHHTARSTAQFWGDHGADGGTDSEAENEEKNEGEEDEDRDVAFRSRHCSYESITAAEGLSAWSFEELRVECYAQSLVARGTMPPPVLRPLLAIPPAFVPRIVPRIS